MSAQKQFDKNNFSFLFQKDKLICVLLVALIFFLDRISKIKIINHQLDNDRVYVNDFINLAVRDISSSIDDIRLEADLSLDSAVLIFDRSCLISVFNELIALF